MQKQSKRGVLGKIQDLCLFSLMKKSEVSNKKANSDEVEVTF
jgi:hypothetical protein